jgi:hypothetical protein
MNLVQNVNQVDERGSKLSGKYEVVKWINLSLDVHVIDVPNNFFFLCEILVVFDVIHKTDQIQAGPETTDDKKDLCHR